jgi:hypothetical protein
VRSELVNVGEMNRFGVAVEGKANSIHADMKGGQVTSLVRVMRSSKRAARRRRRGSGRKQVAVLTRSVYNAFGSQEIRGHAQLGRNTRCDT